jgi:asparagine N-glycosylation enzyme membrane subunit Stt3
MPDNELQTASIPSRSIATPATLANSTTLADLQRKQRNAKAVIAILTTLGSVALLVVQLAPWNLLVGALLFVAAVVVAYFTNALTPEELDALLAKLGGAAERVKIPGAEKKDGAP